jgi:uncharacterized protein with PQ loop repeat
MAPDPKPLSEAASRSDSMLNRLLGVMSLFTMAMTIPQVWTIWVDHRSAGVSPWSWSAYLLSALLWFWHGLRQRDKNIYLPCVGWVLLDLAVIAGVIVQRQ